MSEGHIKIKNFAQDFLAGGTSGILSKTIAAPIERVKLLLQTEAQNVKLKVKYTGILNCLQRCIKEEGVLSLWRGNWVNVIRYFPTQAFNFAFKDNFRILFKVQQQKKSSWRYFYLSVLAGGLAGACTTCFVHPLDFVRTRLAVDLGKSLAQRQFKGLWDCLKQTYKNEGFPGLYTGFKVAIMSIFVYRGLYFGIYDYGKDALLDKDSPIYVKMLWAQVSVLLAEFLAYPGDTIKRKLYMQAGKQQKQYNGMVECFRKVYQREGITGFWKGNCSNIIRGIGSSLCLLIYDETQKLIVKH